MDLIAMVIGGILVWFGRSQRDEDGQRTGTGNVLFFLGIALILIGCLVFTLAFMAGYDAAS
jgi:hypothetical protein